MAPGWNCTQATLMGGKHSHNANPAPLDLDILLTFISDWLRGP